MPTRDADLEKIYLKCRKFLNIDTRCEVCLVLCLLVVN